jgi:outer membrane lipoprotein carrier protein
MKFKIFCFVLYALCAFEVSLHAAPAKLDPVLSKMEQAEKNVRTLSFEFIQSITLSATGEKQEVRGKAFFHKPDKFRVEHVSPRPQTVVSNGKTLSLYNPDRNQVLVDSWENWSRSAGFPRELTPFQMDVDQMRKKYVIVYEKKAEGSRKGDVLKFSPREEGPLSYTLRVWVDPSTGLPFRTELESASVHVATDLTQTKVNPALPDSVFVFEPPEGTEVIESSSPDARQGGSRPKNKENKP